MDNIYWEEQCILCKENNCEYKQDINDFINKLVRLKSDHQHIDGSLIFNCNKFVIDPVKYINYISKLNSKR